MVPAIPPEALAAFLSFPLISPSALLLDVSSKQRLLSSPRLLASCLTSLRALSPSAHSFLPRPALLHLVDVGVKACAFVVR